MKIKRAVLVVLSLLICLSCLTGCGSIIKQVVDGVKASDEAAPESTPKPKAKVTPEPTPEPTPDQSALLLETAEERLAAEEYYDAYSAAYQCLDEYPDSEAASGCAALMDEIREALQSSQPVNGVELERTFQIYGGGTLSCLAESGPTEVTAVDVNNEAQYVRFFVRNGEMADINLPVGVYSVTYKVGDVWFGDDTGFGDFCAEYSVDQDLDFSYSSDSAWVSNTVWTVRLVAD